jgi:HSP20 family protein
MSEKPADQPVEEAKPAELIADEPDDEPEDEEPAQVEEKPTPQQLGGRKKSKLQARIDELVEDGTLKLRVVAPGIDPSADIDLRLIDQHLDLRVTRQERIESTDAQHRHSEVRYGTFRRTLPIPKGTNADDVAANYHDGVLEICVPAGDQARAEKIRVAAP